MKSVQVIKEQWFVEEANTMAKAKEGFFDDNPVADEVARSDDKRMGKGTKGNDPATWIYNNHTRRNKAVWTSPHKSPGGEATSDKTTMGYSTRSLEH